MRLVFVTFNVEGFHCLEALLQDGHSFEAIVTFPEHKVAALSGGVDLGPLAASYGVPLYRVDSVNDGPGYEVLRSIRPDLIFAIGWTEILQPHVLELPVHGCVGMHASLIPQYRGGSPVNWAIIHGEKRTGQTMFWLSSELDKGDIIDQEAVTIDLHDTCGTVYEKAAMAGVRMLRHNMAALLKGEAPSRPQTSKDLPTFRRRKPQDGQIDWQEPAERVYNLIRAVADPYPGAFSSLNEKKVFFWEVDCAPKLKALGDPEPGEIICSSYGFGPRKGAMFIATREGAILARRVQVEGEPRRDAYELMEDGTFAEGDRFT